MQISKAISPTAMGGRRTTLDMANESLQSSELSQANPFSKVKKEKRKIDKQVKSVTPSIG